MSTIPIPTQSVDTYFSKILKAKDLHSALTCQISIFQTTSRSKTNNAIGFLATFFLLECGKPECKIKAIGVQGTHFQMSPVTLADFLLH